MRRLRKGASAIEFALTLPLLMSLVAAVTDFGFFLYQELNVVRAVREAARYGSTVLVVDDPATAAINHSERVLAAAGIDCAVYTCSLDATLSTSDDIDLLTVTSTVVYRPLVGLVPMPTRLRSQLTVAIEDQ